MHILAVLNRDGGALRDLDIVRFGTKLEEILKASDHTVEVFITSSGELVETMREAAADERVEVLLARGGDGTMNLFARSLNIPLNPEEALQAMARGRIRKVDIACANGRFFVHQFSVGMHPKLIRLRERMEFRSRLGKMSASARAAFSTFARPPSLQVALEFNEVELRTATASLAVTNNLYGEGKHLPFTDRPDGGRLGIYIARAQRRRELAWMYLNMGIGSWRANERIDIHEATEVLLRVRPTFRRFKCAMDGELFPLQAETKIEIHPGALRVLCQFQE